MSEDSLSLQSVEYESTPGEMPEQSIQPKQVSHFCFLDFFFTNKQLFYGVKKYLQLFYVINYKYAIL
jgi:hypothetical protein